VTLLALLKRGRVVLGGFWLTGVNVRFRLHDGLQFAAAMFSICVRSERIDSAVTVDAARLLGKDLGDLVEGLNGLLSLFIRDNIVGINLRQRGRERRAGEQR
jgi:hypothetical protein